MAYIKNLKLGTTTYQINATQLEGKNASEYALKTDLSKFDKLALKVVTTLPTASASTQDAIYLLAHAGHTDSPDSYDEYITVTTTNGYAWEKIGNTDVDLSGYCQKGTSTTSSTTGITASASTPTFTGTAHTHTASDKGHTHTYSKITGASFTGTKDQSTSKVTTGITATASAPTFSGISHGHGITEPNKGVGHRHTYYKTTSASFNGAGGTSGNSKTGITASASAPTFSGGSHSHGITEPNSGTGHTHGYDKVTNIWAGTTAATSGSSGTGISATASAPTFKGTAHGHDITDNGHTHTYLKTTNASAAGWDIAVDGSTLIFTSNTPVWNFGYAIETTTASGTGISVNGTTAGGSVSAPTITIKDPGHTHGYTAPTGACGWTYNEGKTTQTATAASTTGISINSASVSGTVSAPSITITDPGHTHGFTPSGSVSLGYSTDTTPEYTGYSTTGISINGATAGGNVSAPTISITDPGHTHTITPSGSVSVSTESSSTGSGTASITINSTTAGGSVSKPTITIADPGHTHKEN